jgi:hypothetical protein
MDSQIVKKRLNEINFNDTFFDSLRDDYPGFTTWIERKISENKWAFIIEIDSQVNGFLFLKSEKNEIIDDVRPSLPKKKWLKIATFKINPHGTRLGDRFLKKVFDTAIVHDFDSIYVTVFSKHLALIELFKKYGFVVVGKKEASENEELVLVKDLSEVKNNILLDYPKFNLRENNKFLLAIYPQYHSRLFPDSILHNENFNIIEDVSYTNSIEKIYICQMDCSSFKINDLLLIYRTKAESDPGKAHYRAVATSICTIEEIKTRKDFNSLNDYLSYCETYSVFNRQELTDLYNKKGSLYVIKMTYNAALSKRVTRGNLIEMVGVDSTVRWNIIPLNNEQFNKIIKLGHIYESLIIN